MLRHYYNIDKYQLRDAIHAIKSLNCAHLNQIALKLIELSGDDFSTELTLKVNKTLDWLKENKEDELLMLMQNVNTNSEMQLKGRLAKYLQIDETFANSLKLYINHSK